MKRLDRPREGGERRVDFLLSISNDAWFLYSNELPQHLAICAFRAVEIIMALAGCTGKPPVNKTLKAEEAVDAGPHEAEEGAGGRG